MEKSIRAAQGQLEAYNKKDLEAFLVWYHPQVKVYDLDSETLTYEGKNQMRARYEKLFRNSGLHCKLLNRMAVGKTVIDHEEVRRDFGHDPFYAIAIYRVDDQGLITSVRFTRGL